MITAESPIKFDRRKQKDDTLLQLYKNILTPRLIEEKMLEANLLNPNKPR